jgi:ligand-binding sensor domain-containing protein
VFETLDAGSRLWFASQAGAGYADLQAGGPVFSSPYRAADSGLPADGVNAVISDVLHVKWFGTDAGVASLQNGAWGLYTKENYWIYDNQVKCIATTPAGMNYFGTEGAGVSRLRMDPVDGITSASAIDWAWSGIASDTVYAILIRANGHQWYGTDKGACMHTSNDTRRDWTVFTVQDGLAHDFVQAIAEDAEGLIWCGTRAGVSRFDGFKWKSFTTADGLAGNEVLDIAVDRDGSLWFATAAGVSHVSGLSAVEDPAVPERRDFFDLRNYPNPFNPSTHIVFRLPRQAETRIVLYDLSGRPVRRLINAPFGVGAHSVLWDGTDDSGLPLPSGLYMVMVSGGGHHACRKIVMSK